jgi:hypothetical protein
VQRVYTPDVLWVGSSSHKQGPVHTFNNSKELLLHGPTHSFSTIQSIPLNGSLSSRIQRRLNAHLVALGDGRENIVAVPSATDQGVHLYFDLEPLAAHSDEPGDINANEGMTEDSDGDTPSESNLDPRSRHVSPPYTAPAPPHATSAPNSPRRDAGKADSNAVSPCHPRALQIAWHPSRSAGGSCARS